jgi:hypothetical protein
VISEEFEVAVDLLVADRFVFLAERIVNHATSVVSGKPRSLVVVASFDGPPERLESPRSMGREPPIHTVRSGSSPMNN